jgi:hypothetical protein
MSSEFAARLGWTEFLGKVEAKVLSAALQAALEVPGEEIEELSESENEALDVLTEGILAQNSERTEAWVTQMGESDRSAIGACLLWLQYPEEEELTGIREAQWRRLEEVYAAVGARAASLGAHEMEMA